MENKGKIQNPKKGFIDEVGKNQADRKLSSPVMAKIVCDPLPTFSSKHPSGNNKGFVITHITKNIDTNNACCSQMSTHMRVPPSAS